MVDLAAAAGNLQPPHQGELMDLAVIKPWGNQVV
jgi:hypothetical protein